MPTGFMQPDEPPINTDAQWVVGDGLQVSSGVPKGLTGVVIATDPDARRLTLRVVVFDRETDLGLHYDEVTAARS